MNWDQLEGKWNEIKGQARSKWGKLSGDDTEQIGGKKDRLVGKLQERYGMKKDEAEKEADGWINNL